MSEAQMDIHEGKNVEESVVEEEGIADSDDDIGMRPGLL